MLTKTDIQKLFDFTTKKYVRYIDVQVELVDHLATSIESLQKNDSSVKFEQALTKVYSRFPITGFNDLVQQKTNALRWLWWHKLKDYFIEYLSWPKCLILVLIFSSLYSLSSFVDFKYIYIGCLIISIVIMLLPSKANGIFSKQEFKFLSVVSYYGFSSTLVLLPQQLIIYFVVFDIGVLTNRLQIVLCIFLSCYFIILYALFAVFPVQLKEDVLKKYKNYLLNPA